MLRKKSEPAEGMIEGRDVIAILEATDHAKSIDGVVTELVEAVRGVIRDVTAFTSEADALSFVTDHMPGYSDIQAGAVQSYMSRVEVMLRFVLRRGLAREVGESLNRLSPPLNRSAVAAAIHRHHRECEDLLRQARGQRIVLLGLVPAIAEEIGGIALREDIVRLLCPERQQQKRQRGGGRGKAAASTRDPVRPVEQIMDSLDHFSDEDLLADQRRLEEARRGPGIRPEDLHRLNAIKALLLQRKSSRKEE